MSATETMRMAEASGIRFGVEGADLILDADLEPSVEVVNAIRCHKAEIIEILGARGDDWTTRDWQAFFDERASIAEFDGVQTRTDAEAVAFECCVAAWLNSNPPEPADPDHCAHCGKTMAEFEALPFLTGDGGHIWMHDRCHAVWMARRRMEAAEALSKLGVSPTTQ